MYIYHLRQLDEQKEFGINEAVICQAISAKSPHLRYFYWVSVRGWGGGLQILTRITGALWVMWRVREEKRARRPKETHGDRTVSKEVCST